MTAPTGLRQIRIQIDGFTKTFSDLVTLRDEVRLALDGYINQTVTVGADSVVVQQIYLDADREDYVKPKDDSDTGMYHMIQDYIVFVPETIPSH